MPIISGTQLKKKGFPLLAKHKPTVTIIKMGESSINPINATKKSINRLKKFLYILNLIFTYQHFIFTQ